jgi:hypothetical protein
MKRYRKKKLGGGSGRKTEGFRDEETKRLRDKEGKNNHN